MALTSYALTSRFEGRLFLEDGRLYFVLDVDAESGLARVSFRADGQQQVVEMPVSEVALRLASNSNPLDGLSGADTSNRIIERSDGWFFTTREGRKGPYATDADAKSALDEHILSVKRAASGDEDRVAASG